MGRGAERKIVQNVIFRGKRHDNKILKVEILLSRNFVVMAQAPRYPPIARFGAVGVSIWPIWCDTPLPLFWRACKVEV